MIDPFDDEGEAQALYAQNLSRLLLEHASVELAVAVEETRQAEIDAHIAAERLEHAMRIQRHWTMRAERAVMLHAQARDLTV